MSIVTLIITILVFTLILLLSLIAFYIFIVTKVRARLEEEIVRDVEKKISELVTHFNRSALKNVDLLDERIRRLKDVVKESENVEMKIAKEKRKKKNKKQTSLKADITLPKENEGREIPNDYFEDSPPLFSEEELVYKKTDNEPSFAPKIKEPDVYDRSILKRNVSDSREKKEERVLDEKPSLDYKVSDDGVSDDANDVNERVINLYDSGLSVSEVSKRVDMPEGEVEVILGFAGKL